MIDELEAELLGHPALQLLDLLVAEFDHVPGLQMDQMVVMGLGRLLVAGAPVAEFSPFRIRLSKP